MAPRAKVAALLVLACVLPGAFGQYVTSSLWLGQDTCDGAPDVTVFSLTSLSNCEDGPCSQAPQSIGMYTWGCSVPSIEAPSSGDYEMRRISAGSGCSGASSETEFIKDGACIPTGSSESYVVTRNSTTIKYKACTDRACSTSCKTYYFTPGVCALGSTLTSYSDGQPISRSPTSIPNVISGSISGSSGGGLGAAVNATSAPSAQTAPPSLPAGTRGYVADRYWKDAVCGDASAPPDTISYQMADTCVGVACSTSAYPFGSSVVACAIDGTPPTGATYVVKTSAYFGEVGQCKEPLLADMYRSGACVPGLDGVANYVYSCNTTDVTVLAYSLSDVNCTGTATAEAYVAGFCDTTINVAYYCSVEGTSNFDASGASRAHAAAYGVLVALLAAVMAAL